MKKYIIEYKCVENEIEINRRRMFYLSGNVFSVMRAATMQLFLEGKQELIITKAYSI